MDRARDIAAWDKVSVMTANIVSAILRKNVSAFQLHPYHKSRRRGMSVAMKRAMMGGGLKFAPTSAEI